MTFRWSFSKWELYNSCPAKYKFKNVDKLPDSPPGPAALRGLEIHDTVEKYIMGQHDVNGLHEAIKDKYIPILDEFKNHTNGDRWCEKKLAFDDDWYLTAPSGSNAACVGILDAVRSMTKIDGTVRIGEWKSGKPKDSHKQQRELYAMFGLKGWLADQAIVTTYYLEDTGPPQRLVVNASAWDKLVEMWTHRVNVIKSDTIFAPRPGFHCRWCAYAKDKGGPCQFGS